MRPRARNAGALELSHAEARRGLHQRPVFAAMLVLSLVVVGAAS